MVIKVLDFELVDLFLVTFLRILLNLTIKLGVVYLVKAASEPRNDGKRSLVRHFAAIFAKNSLLNIFGVFHLFLLVFVQASNFVLGFILLLLELLGRYIRGAVGVRRSLTLIIGTAGIVLDYDIVCSIDLSLTLGECVRC